MSYEPKRWMLAASLAFSGGAFVLSTVTAVAVLRTSRSELRAGPEPLVALASAAPSAVAPQATPAGAAAAQPGATLPATVAAGTSPTEGAEPERSPGRSPSASGSAAAVEATATSFTVKRIVVTAAIDEQRREPQPGPIVLGKAEAVHAFLEVANPDKKAHKLTVTFERKGAEPVGHVKLRVPARKQRWRTWATSKNLHAAGAWVAVVREGEQELARRDFEIQAGTDGESVAKK